MALNLTDSDAITIGQTVAREKGWPWKEPIRLTRRRRGILGFGRHFIGRPILEIRSNAEHESRNVIVYIDDRTGDVIQSSFIPPDPEKTARDTFRRLHPDERVAWTSVRAEEHDRFVVGIFYGRTRPPRYTFFAIDKSTDEVTLVTDDTPYRPKVWR